MRLLHISDLHIGKRVNGFNMIEDQKYILEKIIGLVREENIHGVLMAGDIYDKSQPSTEAVELLDEFLTKLTGTGRPVFIISGNHDSPERLSFGNRIMEKNRLYIVGRFDGGLSKVTLEDEYGPINIHLLPFIKPAMLRQFFQEPMEDYTQTVAKALSTGDIDIGERNILVAHQFVIGGGKGPMVSDSESISVGGMDHVDGSILHDFDYVALGHLHGPQNMGKANIRYAGSPIKYSFSEAHHTKSATIVELREKGEISIQEYPLTPLRDMREIRGPMDRILHIGREDQEGREDYIHVTLTDEEEIYDAIGQLRQVYPNLMALDFENSPIQGTVNSEVATAIQEAERNPMDLFAAFYEMQNEQGLTSKKTEIMRQIFQQAGGDGA